MSPRMRRVLVLFLLLAAAGTLLLAFRADLRQVALRRLLELWPGRAREPIFLPVELDPSARYVVRLWEYDYPTGPGEEPYRQRLGRLLGEFGRQFPNIQVEVEFLDFAGGPLRLEEALAAGTPPDLYGRWWEEREIVHPLQVPVRPYLTRDEANGYHPAAWQAVARAGQLWGWPRWLLPHLWLGNREALAAAGFSPAALGSAPGDGWEWGELATLSPGINDSGRFLLELLLAAGPFSTTEESPAGTAEQWTARLKEADELLARLRERGLPDDPVERAARLLNDFPRGRLALAAGVNPALVQWLIQKGNPEGTRQVLLPIPGPPGNPGRPVVSTADLLVFRQVRYQGDRHTQAAIELARFLSRCPAGGVPGSFLAVPAYLEELAGWLDAGRNRPEISETVRGILQRARGAVSVYPPRTGSPAASLFPEGAPPQGSENPLTGYGALDKIRYIPYSRLP